MRFLSFICTGIAKLMAAAIVAFSLLALIVANQMIPYTIKVGSLVGNHLTFNQAAVFYIGCVLFLLYSGVAGLIRWRLPSS